MLKGANGNTNSKNTPGRQTVFLLRDLGLGLCLNYANAARIDKIFLFSIRSFMASVLTVKSLVHFKLIFVTGIRQGLVSCF